jgi:transposase
MQVGLKWYTWVMKPPLFIRRLIDDERLQLEADRRTADAFRVRRAHIVLASARGLSPKPIAQLVGCAVQTVRNIIHACHEQGVEGLERQSNRPKTVEPALDAATCDRLQHLLHQSPRLYGTPIGVWTLALAAAVCYEQGLTERVLSDESLRRALKRLQTNWKRAKHWITSPDPHDVRKKSGAIA